MHSLLKSVLKTAVYFLDQAENFAGDVRDRVADGVDRATDKVSDLRDQAQHLYEGEDHTLRNVATFAAGLAIGAGAALLLAPASGKETRSSIGEKVQDIGDRVRSRFSSETGGSATGTEGY